MGKKNTGDKIRLVFCRGEPLGRPVEVQSVKRKTQSRRWKVDGRWKEKIQHTVDRMQEQHFTSHRLSCRSEPLGRPFQLQISNIKLKIETSEKVGWVDTRPKLLKVTLILLDFDTLTLILSH